MMLKLAAVTTPWNKCKLEDKFDAASSSQNTSAHRVGENVLCNHVFCGGSKYTIVSLCVGGGIKTAVFRHC